MLIESIIYSDEWRNYSCPANIGYDKHCQTNHSKNKFAGDEVAEDTMPGTSLENWIK